MPLFIFVEGDRTWEGPWQESQVRNILARARIASQYGSGRQVWWQVGSSNRRIRRYLHGSRVFPSRSNSEFIDMIRSRGGIKHLPAAHKWITGPKGVRPSVPLKSIGELPLVPVWGYALPWSGRIRSPI